MRSRNLKPGFFKSDQLAACGPWARLLFAGLWGLADREGRLEDRPLRIKGEVFPYDSLDVSPLLEELAEQRLIVFYTADNKSLISIPAFKTHQNPHKHETPSALPAAPWEEDLKPDPGNVSALPGQVASEPGHAPSDSVQGSNGSGHTGHAMDGVDVRARLIPDSLSLNPDSRSPLPGARAGGSAYDRRTCERFARSLPDIDKPGGFAKSIWKSGDEDERITEWLAESNRPPEEMPGIPDADTLAGFLNAVSGRLNAKEFRRWFGPIERMVIDGDLVRLGVPSAVFQNWIHGNYLDVVAEAMEEAGLSGKRLEFWWPNRQERKSA